MNEDAIDRMRLRDLHERVTNNNETPWSAQEWTMGRFLVVDAKGRPIMTLPRLEAEYVAAAANHIANL